MALSTTFTLKFNGSAVQKGLAKLQTAIKNVGPVAAKSLGFLGGAGALAAGGLLAAAIKLNSLGEEARASNTRLENITHRMGLFGDQADDVAERLLNLADTQGRMLGIDDDVIAATQSKLMTFKELAKSADVAGGAFDRATMAALDMAAAGFGTAETNAVQLGKALNDPVKGINALTRSGITFTAVEKQRIKLLVESNNILSAQDVILKAIEKQVGGTAAATAKASDKIKVSLGQLAEDIAVPFSKEFDKIPGMLENQLPKLREIAAQIGAFTGAAITEAFAGDFTKFVEIGELVGEAIGGGLQVALTRVFLETTEMLFKLIEDYNPFRKLSPDSPKISDYISKGKTLHTEGQTQDLVARLREKAAPILATGKDLLEGPKLSAAELYKQHPEAPRGYGRAAMDDARRAHENPGVPILSAILQHIKGIKTAIAPVY